MMRTLGTTLLRISTLKNVVRTAVSVLRTEVVDVVLVQDVEAVVLDVDAE